MTQSAVAARHFIQSLTDLANRLELPNQAALAAHLAERLAAVRDGRLPQRAEMCGDVHATQHGIGFALRWPGHFVDVDIDGAYSDRTPQQVLSNAWKVAHCGSELGYSTDLKETAVYLRALADQGLCDYEEDRLLWPAAISL